LLVEINFSEDIDQREIEKIFKKRRHIDAALFKLGDEKSEAGLP
tara:strand:+ start:315 stop:446 length:132 start_codon:yes stop_codon:yes gene_type:complete